MPTAKATEFFILGLLGTELTKDEYNFIKNNPMGGIILFKRNITSIEQVIALNQSIIEANAEFPPLICVDQEGGRVARLKGICTDVPPLGQLLPHFTKDPHFSYRLGAMQARELVALGFNLNFAPVCDLHSGSADHVIGDRAFAEHPETVAMLVSRYISGLQGAGLAACAKHFPGHGATSIDSHMALPILDTDVDTLKARELMPFEAAIKANVATIMTAHIVTRSIDQLPATLSERTLNQLLRHQLSFNNVIISDDLDMKAVADNYSLSDIIEGGLFATVDLFIIGNDPNKAHAAIDILQGLLDGHKEIRAAAVKAKTRIDHLRARYVGKPKAPDLEAARSIIRSTPHLELVRACA